MRLSPGQRLTLGGVQHVDRCIALPPGVVIQSDPRNPLVWRREGNCSRLFYFAGDNIDVAGSIDINAGGSWPGYFSAWSFQAPDDLPAVPGTRRNCIVRDAEIFSSTPLGPHDGRDAFGLNLTNDSGQPTDQCAMINVRTDLPIQVSGNGSGPGHRRFRWINCHGRGNHSAGVAASSLSDPSTDGKQTLFSDCLVDHCSFEDAWAFGGFWGQDRESPSRDVAVRNLLVRDSRFHLAGAGGAAYQYCLLLRAGRSGEFSAAFRRCVLDASQARGEARFVHCATPAALAFSDCLFVGDVANHISPAAAVTQRANRQLVAGRLRPYAIEQLPAAETSR